MSHFYPVHPSITKIKEKKKKRNINNNLAVLPSHNNTNVSANLTIEVGLTLLVGMNWNSHALGTKN